MTEDQVKEYLRNRGWPNHVCKGGSKELIRRWANFVASVENADSTRNWLIDDYWILLETRELIHDIGGDDRVTERDKRFGALLTATNIKHRHRDRHSDYDFWNYGYPMNATGFFYQQIKTHILQVPGGDTENH